MRLKAEEHKQKIKLNRNRKRPMERETMKNVDNLTHDKAPVRRAALQALAKLRVGAAPFLPDIIARLADNTVQVRKAAVVALGRRLLHPTMFLCLFLSCLN